MIRAALKFFGIVSGIWVIQFSPAFAALRATEFDRLDGKMFRLQEGAFNRCPQKLGIRAERGITEVKEFKIYPMEAEWKAIRTTVNPILSLGGESQKSLDQQVLWMSNRVTSVSRAAVTDGMTVESHAELELQSKILKLTRWSIADGLPITDTLSCEYEEIRVALRD